MKRILVVLVLLSIASCALFAPREEPVVLLDHHGIETTSGIVQGQFAENPAGAGRDRSVVWRDIPYAQPPVGDLRWRAPRPLKTPTAIIKAAAI